MTKQEKKSSAGYVSDQLILVSLCLGLLVNIILWIVLAGKFGWQNRSIPLHFNAVYGIDFVAKSRWVYQLPGAGLVIFCVNLVLSHATFQHERIFSYFLTWTAAFVQVFLLAAGVALVLSNA